jgi:hypothetical protein
MMLDFLNKPYPFDHDLKTNIRGISGISLGMFLFILFFQPVELEGFDFNNRLLIIAGYGAITLIILAAARLLIPWIFPKSITLGNWYLKQEIILNATIWILNSTAYAFYTRYVAHVSISMYLMFKIVILSIAPVIALIIINERKFLRKYLMLITEQKSQNITSGNARIDHSSEEVEFYSESRSEKFRLKIGNLILIQSADNYIEIMYKENDGIQKTLVRNTLKNIEEQLRKYNSIIRCHRTFIVNINHVSKFIGNYQGYRLKLTDIDTEVPVSRQYLLKVKEALNIS